MKRILTVLLACLLLSLSTCGALAESFSVKGLGAFTFPDGCEYTDERTANDDDEWLFSVYDDDIEFDMYLIQYSETGDSLFSYSEAELQQFIEDSIGTDSDGTVFEYLDTVKPSGVPFVLLSCSSPEDGEYLVADTLANGVLLEAYCYYNDDSAVDDALISTFTDIIASFTPDK